MGSWYLYKPFTLRGLMSRILNKGIYEKVWKPKHSTWHTFFLYKCCYACAHLYWCTDLMEAIQLKKYTWWFTSIRLKILMLAFAAKSTTQSADMTGKLPYYSQVIAICKLTIQDSQLWGHSKSRKYHRNQIIWNIYQCFYSSSVFHFKSKVGSEALSFNSTLGDMSDCVKLHFYMVYYNKCIS